MDIDTGVDISAIQFHINRIYAYYRGENYLQRFATHDATPATPLDQQLGGFLTL